MYYEENRLIWFKQLALILLVLTLFILRFDPIEPCSHFIWKKKKKKKNRSLIIRGMLFFAAGSSAVPSRAILISVRQDRFLLSWFAYPASSVSRYQVIVVGANFIANYETETSMCDCFYVSSTARLNATVRVWSNKHFREQWLIAIFFSKRQNKVLPTFSQLKSN